MSSIIYNDMPGELRERKRLWEVLDKILKNNGFIDADAINTELSNLKNQLNILLSDVLGLEHEIDGIHNYDDAGLKTKLENLQTLINNFTTQINIDINGIVGRLSGINGTASKISLQNTTQIELNTINNQNHGTKINLLPQQIALQCLGDPAQTGENPVLQGLITVGGGETTAGIDLDSDNNITLNNRSGSHHLSVKSDKRTNRC
jgi:hypothetical protein